MFKKGFPQTSSACDRIFIISFINNGRYTIKDIKFKSINNESVFDKSMPIFQGGTYTGQVLFYSFNTLNQVINSWTSNNDNNHHYNTWSNYTDFENSFIYSGLNNVNLYKILLP